MTIETSQLTETVGARKTPLLTPVAPLNIVFALVASKYRAADAVEDLLAALKDKPETKGVLLMSDRTEKDMSNKGAIVSIKNGGAPCFNTLALQDKNISIIELGCKESELNSVARDLASKHSIHFG